jgi:hypothetical protein
MKKGRLLKLSLFVFLFFSAVVLGNSVDAATEATVEEILGDQDSYDGKEVSVSGAVSTPRFKASRHGKPYMTFPLLGESGGRINVLVWEQPKLKKGEKVKITGTYRKVMEMGKYTFRDMIEASEIIRSEEGNK